MNHDENRTPQVTSSGNKLVLAIFGLAVVAGVLSWLYRYRSTHDSTQFWGPNFAQLIAEPSQVTAFELYEEPTDETGDNKFQVLDKSFYRTTPTDLTSVRGMVHLRHSILTDGNYNWKNPVSTDDWRWCLQFTDGDRTATILLTEDFSILGRLNQHADKVRLVDCTPMAETLREYFSGINVFGASKAAE